MQALLDNQVAKIDKFLHLKVGADFGEAGTGKTRSTLELIKSTPCDCCLWIAPFGTLNPPMGQGGIKDEIKKWGGLPIEMDFVAPESIGASDRIFLETLRKLESYSNPIIIVDESLKIKNHDAKRTRRIIELGKSAEYKYILNGTALSRSLLDLWAQFEFLSPKILNMSQAEYKNTICEYTTIKKRFGNRWASKEFITGYANVDYLFSIINPYVFDCDLKLEIGKQYIDLDYELSEADKAEYKRIKEEYLDNEKLLFLNNNIFLELTQKMQHNYSCTENKFEVFDAFLKTVDRTKVLVYRFYTDAQDEFKKRYPDIPCLSIQSHSMSLNLQQYNTTVLWDRTWDYALIEQLEHRTYRTGQTEDCKYASMKANTNLDQLMSANVEKKGKLLQYFKTKGAEELMKLI